MHRIRTLGPVLLVSALARPSAAAARPRPTTPTTPPSPPPVCRRVVASQLERLDALDGAARQPAASAVGQRHLHPAVAAVEHLDLEAGG